jgi:hypothetical protein
MSPLPIGHTFGDTILYYLAAAVLLVLALALLAVLSESLIKIVRALGGALVSLPPSRSPRANTSKTSPAMSAARPCA